MVAAAYSSLVERPRIVDRLRRSAATTKLVLLRAPAGYSKTTCLTQWAELDPRPFATVSCTARHDDPSLLTAAVVEALATIHPVDRGVTRALAALKPDVDEVLDRLGRTLESMPVPFVLAIDDAHLLRAGASRRVLSSLVRAVPAGSQIAIATRSAAPLATGRLRSERAVLEIGAGELAMTHEEAGRLLAGLGLELSTEQADTLHDRTEGWPAALCLAAVALGEQSDPDAAVAAFAGDDRVVVDYLEEELLAALPRKSTEFLMRASLLEELSGPLCDAALERGDSAELLRNLARTNALIVPMDRVDDRYRCHHLLAQMLQAELRHRDPAAEEGIHRRASDWYAAHGEMDLAVEHAIAGGDEAAAGELIWVGVTALLGRGRLATLDRWLDTLGDRAVVSVPALALTAGHRSMQTGEGEQAMRFARMAEAALGADPAPSRRADLMLLYATLAPDGIRRMAADGELATELQDPDSPWQFVISYYRGVAMHLSGHPDRGAPLLRETVRQGAALGPIMQVLALAQLALIADEAGNREEAERCIAQATAQAERCGLANLPSLAMVAAVAAQIHSGTGHVTEASDELERACLLLEGQTGFPRWYVAQEHIALTRAAIRLDELERARGLLERAAAVADDRQGPCINEWLAGADAALTAAESGRSHAGLTKAELRTLQFLPTHLTFREIGERLYLSANTVKTQARAVYRKLDATSRAEAVQRAREAGLLDDPDAAASG